MNGKIKRVVGDKGFGFILGDDGAEYFFHKSALTNWDGPGIEGLPIGGAVTFKAGSGAKGPRAEDVRLG